MTAPRTTAPFEDEVRDAYLRVSHAFEGGREHRRQLYADYLQFFSADDVVLDFGCGDGIWLELLDGRGIKGVGIDYDPDKVAAVHARGLDAICSSELSDAASRGPTALTALHIIEHLPPMDVLRMLMTLDVRKILLCTPNIDYAPVLSNFWRDITHVRPYPRDVAEALCREAGFPGVMSGTQNGEWDSWVFAWKRGTPGWPDPPES
jgi:SAM-dependent methyltransferase